MAQVHTRATFAVLSGIKSQERALSSPSWGGMTFRLTSSTLPVHARPQIHRPNPVDSKGLEEYYTAAELASLNDDVGRLLWEQR